MLWSPSECQGAWALVPLVPHAPRCFWRKEPVWVSSLRTQHSRCTGHLPGPRDSVLRCLPCSLQNSSPSAQECSCSLLVRVDWPPHSSWNCVRTGCFPCTWNLSRSGFPLNDGNPAPLSLSVARRSWSVGLSAVLRASSQDLFTSPNGIRPSSCPRWSSGLGPLSGIPQTPNCV